MRVLRMGFDSHLLHPIPKELSYQTLGSAESSLFYIHIFKHSTFLLFKWFNPVGVITQDIQTISITYKKS